MISKLAGQVTIQEDVEFGQGGGRPLLCDVFTPPDDQANRPAILLVHGGGWRDGDKTQLKYYGIQLARFGFLCVSAEYRLSGEAPWPAQIQDVKTAIRWMRANAQPLGLDVDRIAVSGNSAGAHVALMMGATPNVSVFEGDGGHVEESSECAAVVAIYAPTLLRVDEDEIEGAISQLFGGSASDDALQAASPVTYAHRNFPPTLLIHGNADNVVPVEASFEMYRVLNTAGAPVELHIYDGAPHAFDSVKEFAQQLTDVIALFLDRKVVQPRDVALPPTG